MFMLQPVNLDLIDIKIYNLTSIQRTSDDVVILDNQDLGQMSISLHLIFTKVEVSYNILQNEL